MNQLCIRCGGPATAADLWWRCDACGWEQPEDDSKAVLECPVCGLRMWATRVFPKGALCVLGEDER